MTCTESTPLAQSALEPKALECNFNIGYLKAVGFLKPFWNLFEQKKLFCWQSASDVNSFFRTAFDQLAEWAGDGARFEGRFKFAGSEVIIIAFSWIPPAIVAYVVREREAGA